MELGALEKSITAHRDAIETQRIIVPPVLQALHQARLFRSLIPQAVGGLGLDLPEHMRIIQRLAMVDTSTAWCVNQAAVIATQSLWLDRAVIQQIWPKRTFALPMAPLLIAKYLNKAMPTYSTVTGVFLRVVSTLR